MHVVHPTCAGLDVHKKDVKACLIRRDAQGQRTQQVRTFGTMTKELLALRDWLQANSCRVVAMESTSVYWQPIFNLIEAEFEVLLVNPAHIKTVPGRKTDVKDCEWLAELLEHGLLQGSFIPPVAIRDLRDVTRYRRKLVEAHTAEVNRLHKILEMANIKLASVASNVMGVSGRAMVAALLAGVQEPAQLAELAKGRLRQKKPALEAALLGRFRPHHAKMLTRILGHIDFLEQSISQCEDEIEVMCRPFTQEIALLDTIPGVNKRSAQDLIAEIGVDMSHFASHRHLCSWAGVCPGNNESAGKRKSGRTRRGNKWLRTILIESAHSASHTKNTYLGAQFARFISRKGSKRAAVVVAHSILEAVYFILRDKVPYQDLGAQHLDQINRQRIISHHVRRLQSLGLKVEIQALPLAA